LFWLFSFRRYDDGFERLAKKAWLVFPAQAVALGLAALYILRYCPVVTYRPIS
jgi:hypothetical protein